MTTTDETKQRLKPKLRASQTFRPLAELTENRLWHKAE